MLMAKPQRVISFPSLANWGIPKATPWQRHTRGDTGTIKLGSCQRIHRSVHTGLARVIPSFVFTVLLNRQSSTFNPFLPTHSRQLAVPIITLFFAHQTPTQSRRNSHRFIKTYRGISEWNVEGIEEKGRVKVDQLYGLQIRYQERLCNK